MSVTSITILNPSFQEGTAWPSSGLGEIATFTTNDGGQPYQYNVTINWGDGTAPTSGTVNYDPNYNADSNPLFDIDSAHTYSNAGDYTITIGIQDSVDATNATTPPDEGQVVVAGQALTASATQTPISAVVGTPLNNADVGTFSSANPLAVPSDFQATINWGDGVLTAGTIVQDASGLFHVDGTHTFSSVPSQDDVTVTIQHPGATGANASLTFQTPITVSAAPLILTPGTVTVSDSSIQSGASVIPAGTVVGTFTDAGGPGPESNYTSAASYVQFPGAVSTNTPIPIAPTVPNGSTYTIETATDTTFASPLVPGTEPFAIEIENTADAAIVQGSGSLIVTDAPLSQPADGQPTIAPQTRGSSFMATVAAFTDPDTLASPSDFTAIINWGDGTAPTIGIVDEVDSSNPNDLEFDVEGTHTYATAGLYPVSVEVQGITSKIAISNPDAVAVSGAPLVVAAPEVTISDASIKQGQSDIPAGTVVGTFTDTGGADPANDYMGAGSYVSFPGSATNTPVLVAPVVSGSSTFTVTTAADTFVSPALAPGTEDITLQITNTDGNITQSEPGTLTVTDAALGLPASGQPLVPNQVRGSEFTATVAAFTDPDTLATTGDFAATINWGDGTTSAGTIIGSDGSFQVQGSHTYETASPAGGFAVGVSIEGVAPFTATLSPSNFVNVAGSPLQVAAATVTISDASIEAPGQSYIPAGTVVGTFTDTGGADAVGNYTGDGSYVSFPGASASTPIAVSLSGSTFTITTATNTVISPRLVPGSQSFQLQITNSDGAMSASAFGTLTVTDAALAAPNGGQAALAATRGSALTATVAAFTDPDTLAAASDFTATINWGDGTAPTTGTVVRTAAGSFEVQSSHTYTGAGAFTITADVQGLVSTISLMNSVTVQGAALQLSTSPVTISDASIMQSRSFIPAGTMVGTFTDTGGADPSADYTSMASYVSFPGATGRTLIAVTPVVSGSSTFTITTAEDTMLTAPLTPGTSSFTLRVTNSDGAIAATASGSLTVTESALTDPTGPSTVIPTQVRGAGFAADVASFTDPDTLTTAADFTATINWGDGTTSAGTVTGSAGSFLVQGTHTYTGASPAGGFPIGISIRGVSPYTASIDLSNTVVVSGSRLQVSATPVTVSDASINSLGQSVIPAGTVVGTFTDTGGADPASDYTGAGSFASFPGATSNTPISVSLVGSTFTVTTAADTVILPRLLPGSAPFLLQVSNSDGNVAATASGTLNVTSSSMSGPQVVGMSFDRSTDQLTVTFQDASAALDQQSLIDPANYRVSRQFAQRGPNLVREVWTSGPVAGSDQQTVTLQLGAPIQRGIDFLTVYSGGIEDVAGNPLTGGSSGNAPSGSNFVGAFRVGRGPHRPQAVVKLAGVDRLATDRSAARSEQSSATHGSQRSPHGALDLALAQLDGHSRSGHRGR
jgi:large repetitive protein